MSEKREETAKALRRAWREFTEKVNRMGNVTLHCDVRESISGDALTAINFVAHAGIEE